MCGSASPRKCVYQRSFVKKTAVLKFTLLPKILFCPISASIWPIEKSSLYGFSAESWKRVESTLSDFGKILDAENRVEGVTQKSTFFHSQTIFGRALKRSKTPLFSNCVGEGPTKDQKLSPELEISGFLSDNIASNFGRRRVNTP